MNLIEVGDKVTNKNDGSIFTGYRFNIGKTIWGVVTRELENKTESVTVSKISPNPWLTCGKEFDSFNEAVGNYKNPSMKLNLRLIETGI